MPFRRSRAASMSASVGAVRIVNAEDLVEDLADGAQRVELAPLHLVQQAAQLRVVRHRLLEVLLRARGGDREDLAAQIAAASLLQLAGVLEVAAVQLDLLPQ